MIPDLSIEPPKGVIAFIEVFQLVLAYFGAVDFRLLYEELHDVSITQVALYACLFALSVSFVLFWNTSLRSSLVATLYMLISIGAPFALAVKLNPAYLQDIKNLADYGKFVIFPTSFAPILVYPVAQGVLILVALSSLVGFSRKGDARYVLSLLGLLGACGALLLQCQTSRQSNYHALKEHGVRDLYDGYILFLDAFFLAVAATLGLLIAPFITKNFDERVRLLQGSVILYDAFRLLCLRDFKQTWSEDKKLILMHVFAGPMLALINLMASSARKSENRNRNKRIRYEDDDDDYEEELTFAPTPRLVTYQQPRLQQVRAKQRVMFV